MWRQNSRSAWGQADREVCLHMFSDALSSERKRVSRKVAKAAKEDKKKRGEKKAIVAFFSPLASFHTR